MNIREIHLLTDDLENTHHFYGQVLELETQILENQTLLVIAGRTKLIFHPAKNAGAVYHIAFDIPHNKLEEAYQWVNRRATVIPVSDAEVFADFDIWLAKSFYFYDNNGNILELICRRGVANASEAPFDTGSFLYASEFGIVTDNVLATAQSISGKYGLPFFERQPPRNTFAALGDDYGLFVIVDSARNWYPTNRRAKSYWSKIVFDLPERKGLVLETD